MEVNEIIKAYFEKERTEEQNELLEEFINDNDFEEIEKCFKLIDGYESEYEYYLYDYDSFLEDYVLENAKSHSNDYLEGFEEVFDFLSGDEQRRFVFHKYIKYSDEFYPNNYSEWQEKEWMDRCLYYILEVR